MSVRPAFAGGSHDRQNRRVGRKEGIDPRGEFVARPTPVASEAEAGMVVEEIERLDKESAGVMVGHGGFSVGPIPDRQPRSEEHTSELQSRMRITYAFFRLTTKH